MGEAAWSAVENIYETAPKFHGKECCDQLVRSAMGQDEVPKQSSGQQ